MHCAVSDRQDIAQSPRFPRREGKLGHKILPQHFVYIVGKALPNSVPAFARFAVHLVVFIVTDPTFAIKLNRKVLIVCSFGEFVTFLHYGETSIFL